MSQGITLIGRGFSLILGDKVSKYVWIETLSVYLFAALPLLFILGRSVADVSVGLIGLLFLVYSAANCRWQWLRDPLFKYFILVWGWLFIASALANVDISDSFGRALGYGRFIVFVFAVKYLVLVNSKKSNFVLICLSLVLLYTVADTVFQFVTGFSFEGRTVDEPNRLTGPFNQLVVGTYLSKLGMIFFGGLVTWTFCYAKRYRSIAVASVVAAISFIFAVMVSGERMAFLSLLLAVGVFAIFVRDYRKPIILNGFVIGTLIVAALASMPATRARVVDYTIRQLSSFHESPYGKLYTLAYAMILENPIDGVGLKNYRLVCEEDSFQMPEGVVRSDCSTHPHNVYLEWAAESGLIGLVLFMLQTVCILYFAIRNVAGIEGSRYYIGLGALTAIIPFLWPFMSSMSAFSNWNAILYWYVMAWVIQYTPKPSA